MRPTDLAELVLLAALWGARSSSCAWARARSALPRWCLSLRVAGASLLLLPLALSPGPWRGAAPALAADRGGGGVQLDAALRALRGRRAGAQRGPVGHLQRHRAAVAATIAWLAFGERPAGWRAVGLALGFAGVAGLGASNASFKPGEHGVSRRWASRPA